MKLLRKSMSMGLVGSNLVGPGQANTSSFQPDYLGFNCHISTNRTGNLFTSVELGGVPGQNIEQYRLGDQSVEYFMWFSPSTNSWKTWNLDSVLSFISLVLFLFSHI